MSAREQLRMTPTTDPTSRAAHDDAMVRDIVKCQQGDWMAKNHLARTFNPLIHTLAEKRAPGNNARINDLIAVGREGLYKAVKLYQPKMTAARFRVIATEQIQLAMDRGDGGFWQRLFGKRA